jgi:ABC-type cobalamin/Fe3+-siderophores transport system ATPase subunit
VISVKDLVVGVIDDDKSDAFRFKIEYGTFDINLGDFVLLKGRNGCGKSTFLRLFHLQGVDYFKVIGGGIYFNEEGFPDKSIHQYSTDLLTKLNCMVSYIGQEERFQSSDSAYSFIYNCCKLALSYDKTLSLKQRREKLEEIDKIIFEYYEKYLESSFKCKNYKIFKNKNVRFWSGGQQKMINVLAGIIKAKVCGLKLMVMDEPLNNLDGRNKDILNNLIADLRSQEIAIIAITHCQIFGGVNKVINLVEDDDSVRRATLVERAEPQHAECLEEFH